MHSHRQEGSVWKDLKLIHRETCPIPGAGEWGDASLPEWENNKDNISCAFSFQS